VNANSSRHPPPKRSAGEVHALDSQTKKQIFANRCRLFFEIKHCARRHRICEPRWRFGGLRPCALENIELPMRMPCLLYESLTAAPDPFASQNLWFRQFPLTADVQREASFDKPEFLFCSLFLPSLPIACPGKNIAGDGAERNDAVRLSAVACDHLAGAPAKCHDRGGTADLWRKG